MEIKNSKLLNSNSHVDSSTCEDAIFNPQHPQTTDVSKKIEHLLDIYFSQLRKEADNGWTDAYKKTEDFFCRLLNKIYGWELYNRNYVKTKESDIDLSSFDRKISVQVTAQKDKKYSKVSKTISGFKERKSPIGFKEIFVAFLDELPVNFEKEWENLNDIEINFNVIRNIITPKTLKREIQRLLTIQEQLLFSQFLEQEIYPLESGVESISVIKSIKDSFNKQDEFYTNEKFYQNNWIVLAQSEFELFKRLRTDLTKNKFHGSCSYLLLGNSCSGKTTFSFFSAKLIEKQTIIKCFYLKITINSKLSNIKRELTILNNNFSLLIVDEIERNLSFSDELYLEIQKYKQIQCLFLSRNTSKITDELEGQVYNRNYIWKEFYTLEGVSEKERISNLISNRLNFLKKSNTRSNYEIGDWDKIYQLTNFNLLKLSILLHFWGKEGGVLSDIDNEKLNQTFYESYDFKNRDEIELILRYSTVYSYNIPFQKQLPYNDDKLLTVFDRLEEKGLFQKENSFYVFQHTEFANLLVLAIISQFPDLKADGINKVKQQQFIKYLNSTQVLPENFIIVFENLIENNETDLIDSIFSDIQILTKTVQFFKGLERLPHKFNFFLKILSESNKRKIFNEIVFENQLLDKIIEYFSTNSYKSLNQFIKYCLSLNLPNNEDSKKAFIQAINKHLPFENIRLYEQNGFELRNTLYKLFEIAVINENEFYFGRSIKDKSVVDFVNQTPINELTLQIAKDFRNNDLTLDRLSVLDFSFWMEKFYNAPFVLIGNCLSELQKTNSARQLAYDIYLNLNQDLLLSKALNEKRQPIKISKCLNELTNFKSYDNNKKIIEISNQLLLNQGFNNNINRLKLNDFARFISDISFNKSLAESLLNSRTMHEYSCQLKIEFEGLYSTTQIINNLNSVSPTLAKQLLKDFIDSEYIESKNVFSDLNGIHEFKKCLKNYDLTIRTKQKKILKNNAFEALINETDLTKIAKSLIEQKSNKQLIEQAFELPQLTIKNFILLGSNDSFRISHLQQILPKLKTADLDLGHNLYVSLSDEYFINPANRTFFHGVCHALSDLNKIDIDYSKTKNCISNKTKSILKCLCINKRSRFLEKARKSEIDDFMTGYHQLWSIDSALTKQYLEPILIKKSQNGIISNTNISTFGQGIKRLIDLDRQSYYSIGQTLFQAHMSILKQTTKILDIRKISAGFEQISILETEFDQFVYEISDLLLEKCKKENTRADFKLGVLPELEKALKGTNGKEIIKKIKEQID